MEQLVEKAAADYAAKICGLNHKKTARKDFAAGARFMAEKMRWISVEEKLPPTDTDVLAKKAGRWVAIARLISETVEKDKKPCTSYKWVAGNSYKDWDVTHWREIE